MMQQLIDQLVKAYKQTPKNKEFAAHGQICFYAFITDNMKLRARLLCLLASIFITVNTGVKTVRFVLVLQCMATCHGVFRLMIDAIDEPHVKVV